MATRVAAAPPARPPWLAHWRFQGSPGEHRASLHRPGRPPRSPGVWGVCQEHLEPGALPIVQRHLVQVFDCHGRARGSVILDIGHTPAGRGGGGGRRAGGGEGEVLPAGPPAWAGLGGPGPRQSAWACITGGWRGASGGWGGPGAGVADAQPHVVALIAGLGRAPPRPQPSLAGALGPRAGAARALAGPGRPQGGSAAPRGSISRYSLLPQILDELHAAELLKDAAEELSLQAAPGRGSGGGGGGMGRCTTPDSRLCCAPPPQTACYWQARRC